MVGRTVDLIAVGPCPNDPYDPAAPAWALAAGMATWGTGSGSSIPPDPRGPSHRREWKPSRSTFPYAGPAPRSKGRRSRSRPVDACDPTQISSFETRSASGR